MLPSGIPSPTVPSKNTPVSGIRFAATPLPTEYRYGMRSETPGPWTSTAPEYEPGEGTPEPLKDTFTVFDAPGLSDTFVLSIWTAVPELADATETLSVRFSAAGPELVS